MLRLTNINTNVLEWALNYSAKGSELSDKFPKLSSWITKEEFPTVKQLEKFADATHVPFGYFFLDKEPEIKLPVPFFRTNTKDSLPSFSTELIDTLKIVQQRQSWLKDYLIHNGAEKLAFVGSERDNNSYVLIAQKIREQLELTPLWASAQPNWETALNFLIDKIENAGINVIRNGIVENNTHRKLDFKEFRGFVLVDNYAPFLFINGADFKSAQMFTLAHELAHIWLGSSAIFDLRLMMPAENQTEKLCNKVAAEFLVPQKELRKKYGELSTNEDIFQKLGVSFKVSKIVIARRLLDLKYISRKEFFDFYNEYITNIPKEKKSTGGDYYKSQPLRIGRRFANAVITAAKEGSLLYRDAYKLTGLKAKTFNEFVKKFYET